MIIALALHCVCSTAPLCLPLLQRRRMPRQGATGCIFDSFRLTPLRFDLMVFMHIFSLIPLSLACSVVALSATTPALFSPRQFDKLLSASTSTTTIERVKSQPPVYRACIFRTFPFRRSAIEAVVFDFPTFPTTFRYVYKLIRIDGSSHDSSRPQGSWFGEGRAGIARLWGIGDVRDFNRTPKRTTLQVTQNSDEGLNARYRQEQRNFFTVEVRNLVLACYLEPRGADSCRMGIVAQAQPLVALPPWLFQLGLRIVLPRMIEDLEREIVRRNATLWP